MDSTFVYALLGLIVIVNILAIIFFFLSKNNSKDKQNRETDFLLKHIQGLESRLDSRLHETYKSLDNKLAGSEREMKRVVENQFENSVKLMESVTDRVSESERHTRKSVENQFQEANKLIQDITKELTEVKEGNKQVLTITDQLANLEKVLKHQKQRGNLGEASLELILSNILPPGAYQMQYEFSDKTKADAVISTKDGKIAVDAKFSLDNYQRIINEQDEQRKQEYEKAFREDLKRRIDETAKYIKPDEGTLPFAFMFIPAEGIYYDLLVNEVGAVKVNTRSLIDYAYNDKKVIIVSPTTFYAYLQSVLYGFKAFKIEESAKGIQKKVDDLQKHLLAFDDYYKKIGSSMSTMVNHYNNGYKEFKKIDKDIVKITGGDPVIDPDLIEKPLLE
jgi:DNA recombination protein RmuC